MTLAPKMRGAFIDHHCAIGQVAKGRSMYLRISGGHASFAVQDRVDLGRLHRWSIACLCKSGRKCVCVVSTAFETGTVSGGEGGRLIKEKELRIGISRHHLASSAFEVQDARDPCFGRPTAARQSFVGKVHPPAAIAHERSARRSRDNFTGRRDAILQAHWLSSRPRMRSRAFSNNSPFVASIDGPWSGSPLSSSTAPTTPPASRTMMIPAPTSQAFRSHSQ